MNMFTTEANQVQARERAYTEWNIAIEAADWPANVETAAQRAADAAWYTAIAKDYADYDTCDWDAAALAAWDIAVRVAATLNDDAVDAL